MVEALQPRQLARNVKKGRLGFVYVVSKALGEVFVSWYPNADREKAFWSPASEWVPAEGEN